MLLDPVVLLVSVLVKGDKNLVHKVALFKGVFLGLIADNISDSLIKTDYAVVLNDVAGAILEITKDLAVKIKVRALGRNGNIITTTVDSRGKGKFLVQSSGITGFNDGNVCRMFVLVMVNVRGVSGWELLKKKKNLTMNTSAVGCSSLRLFKIESNVKCKLEVNGHCKKIVIELAG